MSDTTTDPQARTALIAGFRALADFLDSHPGLPVPRHGFSNGLTVYPDGTDADKRAEVDRIATVLEATSEDYGVYQAARQFGGRVAYRIVAVPDAATDRADPGGEP